MYIYTYTYAHAYVLLLNEEAAYKRGRTRELRGKIGRSPTLKKSLSGMAAMSRPFLVYSRLGQYKKRAKLQNIDLNT